MNLKSLKSEIMNEWGKRGSEFGFWLVQDGIKKKDVLTF